MQIRQRLTYQFLFVVAFILLLSSISIYYFSADYRQDDFYTRLLNKAYNTAKLLIEVEEVDANLLRRIEKDNPASLPKENIIIFSDSREILYSSDEDQTIIVPDDILDLIHSGEEVHFRQGDFEILGFLFSDQKDQFLVVAGAVDIYGKSKLRNLRTVLLVVFGISIILVFLSGWVYAGRALRPISRVIDQVDDITITSLDLRVAEGTENDEISKLAHTFNNKLERLETAFKMQKNFIANASHELRTPLTTITGQLEVALMNVRTNTEYENIMYSVLEDIKNLNTASNRLLLLAQASSETSEIDFRPVRIDDVVWQGVAELRKRNPDYHVSVSLDDAFKDEVQLTVMGNEQLIKTALVNLIDNGCKYSAKHRIHVNIYPAEQQVRLSFLDRGVGIVPADLPHIFEPFYRGKNTGSVRGHGIGLSLVERIIRLHRGRIQVFSELGKGTTFEVAFPIHHF
jgi:signal transduction histidine kinase